MEADRTLPETMALWQLPDDQVGLKLGDRWFPASADILEPIPVGPDLDERLRQFEAACKPFFDRVLYGDPSEEVERLLQPLASPSRAAAPEGRISIVRDFGPEIALGIVAVVEGLDLCTDAKDTLRVSGRVVNADGAHDLDARLGLVMTIHDVTGKQVDQQHRPIGRLPLRQPCYFDVDLRIDALPIAELRLSFEERSERSICSKCGRLKGGGIGDGWCYCSWQAYMRRIKGA